MAFGPATAPASPWYLTGVMTKWRTCGSSGFSDASERVRRNAKPAASRRRSRRRCTADGMIPVANFLASCAGAGSTSHSKRRYPSLHSGMLSSSSALRRWCDRYVAGSQARCRFNRFGQDPPAGERHGQASLAVDERRACSLDAAYRDGKGLSAIRNDSIAVDPKLAQEVIGTSEGGVRWRRPPRHVATSSTGLP